MQVRPEFGTQVGELISYGVSPLFGSYCTSGWIYVCRNLAVGHLRAAALNLDSESRVDVPTVGCDCV